MPSDPFLPSAQDPNYLRLLLEKVDSIVLQNASELRRLEERLASLEKEGASVRPIVDDLREQLRLIASREGDMLAWKALVSDHVEGLRQEAREARSREKNLIWKIIGAVILAGLGVLAARAGIVIPR